MSHDFKVVATDVNVFIFQKNNRFVMKTTTKNRKQNDRFFKQFVFLKWSFLKRSIFIKFVVSLMIVNDDPSLTIFNNEPSLEIVNNEPLLAIINNKPLLTIVNNDSLLTIVNNNPLLTIFNDDPFVNDCKRREER